jgi:hypothetical protein
LDMNCAICSMTNNIQWDISVLTRPTTAVRPFHKIKADPNPNLPNQEGPYTCYILSSATLEISIVEALREVGGSLNFSRRFSIISVGCVGLKGKTNEVE